MNAFRLSAQQERIWWQQTDSPGPFWSVCHISIQGIVDAARLRSCLATVAQRHEILHTVFQRQPGLKLPFQVIEADASFTWRTFELPSASPAALLKELQSEVNLDSGPLLLACLSSHEDAKSVLSLSVPALCGDGKSLRRIVEEVAEIYSSGASGRSEESEDEVLQYADLVEWQEELLTGDDTRAGRDFWRDYCRDLAPESFTSAHSLAPLPACFAAHIAASSAPAAEDWETILACWRIFLARAGRTGAIGCALPERKFAELENAIGPFATWLPVVFELNLTAPVSAAANETRRVLRDLSRWQESFAWSHAELPAGIDRSASLLYLFDFADLSGAVRFGEARGAVLEDDSCGERCELRLSVRRLDDGLSLRLFFDAERFAPTEAQGLLRSFAALLEASAATPATPAGKLPLLSAHDREEILLASNRTAADYPRERCLHQLFEEQVQRTPARIAVRCAGEQLTYKALNEEANRIAHALETAGIGPGALVGLCLDRGTSMIAAVLGIFKSGGAYVAISADHPKARLSKQLEGLSALVTQKDLLARLPAFAGPAIVPGSEDLQQYPATDPARDLDSEAIAYVIYTSGSTGTPKGVAVRHRNLVNYAWFVTQLLHLEDFPEGLQFATVSTLAADLGNTCIYPSLISGGCLHVIPHDVSSDAERFRACAAKYPIDVLKIVPSHLAALLDSSDAGRAGELLPSQFLLMGGEALTTRLFERIAALQPRCQVINHYGPTETTVGSLTLRLQDYVPAKRAATIPIGRPIANTRVYVLDAAREPLPSGVAGELYIAGDGVTAGYLNQPEKTAERFVPDPFTGGTMYRTGDLVRRLPAGEIEFLGRADDQVKIRGFRIEPGEIEAVLAQHAAVRQAVVAARADQRGDNRLIAWVAAKQGDTSGLAAELRAHLQKQLPDYMVPAAIVILARLPLTPNGKIDRQQLPEPEATSSQNVYVAPRTPLEGVIAGIWAEVLKRDQVGVHDNFFEAGGHSLLATQVISRVRRSLDIDPPLRVLFESPTIAKLAGWIEAARHEGASAAPPPLMRTSREQAIPLSFAQQRLWVIDRFDPDNPMYNIPRSMRIKGMLNLSALEQALNEIVRRHESQRTTFDVQNGTPVQKIAPSLSIALPVEDLQHLPFEEREDAAKALAREEALRPFRLTTGPLVRAQVIRLAPDDHLFLLTAHHIVSDAWSAGIFLREMGTLYEAFADGKPSPLPEPAVQYADYAVWQRQWLRGEALDRQLAYWREHLLGAPPVLTLPLDRPRSSQAGYDGASEAIPVAPEVVRGLRALVREEDVTLFMALLAGFNACLSRLTGQEQIILGTDFANRTTAEAEQIIGFFINMLPLRMDLSGNPTFRELLRRVRSVALGAYAHQDIPFDKIVEELQPDRSSEHSPIVQALFVMQNAPAVARELPGLQLAPMPMPVRRSKFDLAIFMTERGEDLTGYWVYRTDLLERSTVLRLAAQFENVLRSAIAAPDTRLSGLSLLSADEQMQADAQHDLRRTKQQSRLRATEPKAMTLSPAGPATGN